MGGGVVSPTGRDLSALRSISRPAAVVPDPTPATEVTPPKPRKPRKPRQEPQLPAAPSGAYGPRRTVTVYLAATLKEEVAAAAAAAKSTIAEWVLDQLDQLDTPDEQGRVPLDTAFAAQRTTRTSGLPARTRQARPRSVAGSSLQLKLTGEERQYIEGRVEATGAASVSAFLARVCELGLNQQ